MKKIKNKLLLVLLFSFAFVVVHDYAMLELDKPSYKVESSFEECQTLTQSADEPCAVSHLHDSVHTMIAKETDALLTTSLIVDNKLSYTKTTLSSHNNFVLERPPLS
ncbi:MAG: hypothetical protein U9Q40_08480 [Campylobacterota bacterium]|nr:hypothetical protein [Campylobacterota bacterium]